MARWNSPCRKTYGEYLKKKANRASSTVPPDLYCRRYSHSTSRLLGRRKRCLLCFIVTALSRPGLMLAVFLAAATPLGAQPVATPAESRVLRWAGDAEGGAPYVEADPNDPSRVVGFDVEVAELIARGLGRDPRFVEVAFTSIDQSIVRGDADIGL